MLRDETLIIKFLPAGGLAAGAIMACEVTTLEHKPWNKSVTAGNFITKSFLPTAQEHESFLLPLELCLQTAQKDGLRARHGHQCRKNTVGLTIARWH